MVFSSVTFLFHVRDNFGWRDRVIRWHHLFKHRALGESPVTDVIVGRNGWLFFSNPADGLDIRNFSGHWPHEPAAVDGWLSGQEGRRRQYARLGARYLIAVAPDKQSLYPEFVPFRYGPPAPGVMGELLARVSSYPDLPILDLRPALREGGGELYYKGDTHWNGRGAFIAASVIADRLRRDLPSVGVIRESEYAVAESVRDVGDLTNMMGLGLPANDRAFAFRRRAGGAREISSTSLNRVFEQPGSGLPTAVLLGDSFGDALAPLRADAFSRLHYYRSSIGGPNPALIVEEKPDVVILMSVERYLPHLGGR
jgi:alginate O-acetyltransferase complex protein AlgJ